MPPPRKVARELRATATKIARIPDETVANAATFAVDQGAGAARFRGRPLTVVIRSQSRGRQTASATVAGKTAGAWSILSYGRRGGYTVRARRRDALNLRSAGVNIAGRRVSALRSTRPGPTSGTDLWNRVVRDPTVDEFADIVDDLIDDAL